MSPPLVILVPVLDRPHHIARLLGSIRESTPEPHRILFITSPNDSQEKEAIDQAGGKSMDCDAGYAGKINAGVRATDEALVFLGADDLHFHVGWLAAALDVMTETIGVVGTNDLGNRAVIEGRHATHSLVARWYAEMGTIDDPAKLLHEGYDHNYVDDEFVSTAKYRRAWAHASASIVEHLHPDWGKAPRDNTYILGHRRYDDDGRLFERRAHLWT